MAAEVDADLAAEDVDSVVVAAEAAGAGAEWPDTSPREPRTPDLTEPQSIAGRHP